MEKKDGKKKGRVDAVKNPKIGGRSEIEQKSLFFLTMPVGHNWPQGPKASFQPSQLPGECIYFDYLLFNRVSMV